MNIKYLLEAFLLFQVAMMALFQTLEGNLHNLGRNIRLLLGMDVACCALGAAFYLLAVGLSK